MITISPIENAFLPVDSDAAQKVSAPNYDEFQGNLEIYNIIKSQPNSILTVTMGHCDVDNESQIMKEGSEEALEHSRGNFEKLLGGSLIKEMNNVFCIYEIDNKALPDNRLIGLVCMAKTGEIKTDDNPDGTIIRNEGIREYKARDRANLTEKVNAFIGMVNNSVEDTSGKITSALEEYADSRPCDHEASESKDRTHKIWIISEQDVIDRFIALFQEEPFAFVADGNHRSAAAAMLGYENFLTVIFPVYRMTLAPYNRLVRDVTLNAREFMDALKEDFTIEKIDVDTYQPDAIHDIGIYMDKSWYKLVVKPSAFDPADAVQTIDSNIVQEKIFTKVLDISDNKDPRLNFVGGNKDAAYLKSRVDNGEFSLAITLCPVAMQQFIDVCKQGKYMPPKSTWFDPKVRSGLVVAKA